ncbi:MAG: ComEC/Rec2 family competence protein [Eubacteriales bacterium]
MNVFGGRPGFAAGVTAIIAILAVAFFTPSVPITLLIVCALVAAVLAVLCACRYITPYRLLSCLIVTVVFAAALLRGMTTFNTSSDELNGFSGEDRYIHATVRERRSYSDFYSVYTVKLNSIDGNACDALAVLNCEYNSDLQVGYEFVLRRASIAYVPELSPDYAISPVSENIFLSVDSVSPDDCIILSEDNYTASDRLRSLNSFLSAKLRHEIGGEEGRLAAAMLLGDRSALSLQTRRDFARSGLSHYLAVSGLHVSIIICIVAFLLMHLRIKKIYINLLLAVFALLYLLLLGFPVSAVRSVVMLALVFMAYSMGDNADPLNSLGIAAALIVLISPTSVFDAGFILSFAATAGIVCFMPILNSALNKLFRKTEKQKRPKLKAVLKSVLGFVFGTLISTSAALSLTLLPSAFIFGEISVMCFYSNFAAAFVGAPLLGSTLFYLLLGNIPYVGEGLIFVIRTCARYLIDLTARLSETKGALISLTSKHATVIVLTFSLLIYVFLVVKFKNKKSLIALPLAYPLVLVALVISANSGFAAKPEITFLATGRDECALVAYENSTALIDISDGSLSRLRMIGEEAHASGYTEFDTLILTHYHTGHISSVSRFVAEEKVRSVVLPYPENENDGWIMRQISDMLASRGIPCGVVSSGGSVDLPGELRLRISDITRLERSNHPMISFSVYSNGMKISYVGESAWESDKLADVLNDCDIAVFGSHGPIAKTEYSSLPDSAYEYVFLDGAPLDFFRGLHADTVTVNVGRRKITFTD